MKIEPIFLSVIVPVYNVEAYIEQCLDSLVKQTYKNIEIILVDDGSTDRSGDICDKYAALYEFISVYHKKNGGLSSARNYGIEKALGEYLSFIDSDDWIKESMFEMLVKGAIESEADVVICNCIRYFTQENQKVREIKEKNTTIYKGQKAVIRLYTDFSAWNKIYKKILFQSIRYPEGKLYEDARTTYRIADKVNRLMVIPEPLYFYRQRGTGIMGTFQNKNYLDRVHVWTEIYEFEKDKFPKSELKNILYRKDKLITEILQGMIKNKEFIQERKLARELVHNLSASFASNGAWSLREKLVVLFYRFWNQIF